ncbi:MAG: hypothetical protein K0S45_2941 [Nitrospira sp.]|jgi:hypothetical protein|nr:hypothetical protein [Nitrospira sp.]
MGSYLTVRRVIPQPFGIRLVSGIAVRRNDTESASIVGKPVAGSIRLGPEVFAMQLRLGFDVSEGLVERIG